MSLVDLAVSHLSCVHALPHSTAYIENMVDLIVHINSLLSLFEKENLYLCRGKDWVFMYILKLHFLDGFFKVQVLSVNTHQCLFIAALITSKNN